MEDIRDIKGIVPVPYPWWVWLGLLALLLILVLVWWRKRRRPTTATGTVAPPTPLEIALAALQRLREEQPGIEEFYTRLSGIVRQYIEGRFGLRAPERTTEEFLAEATLPADSMALLSAFLQEADLVKFARHRPGREDVDRAFAAAETFIRRSDIPVATPAPERGRNAAPTSEPTDGR